MKIRGDFQTNSSSASFILIIKSKDNDLKEFQKNWKKFINFFKDNHHWITKEKEDKMSGYYKRQEKTVKEYKEKEKNEGWLNESEKFYLSWAEEALNSRKKDKKDLYFPYSGIHLCTKILDNVFEISMFTSCFNTLLEIPQWTNWLILKYNEDPKFLEKKFGFKEIKLKVEEDPR